MTITCHVATQSLARVKADLLAVPVYAKRVLGPGAEDVDRALGGGLATFMTGAGFTGKPGETLLVPVRGLGAKTALLVGVGAKAEVSAANLRRAAAAIARRSTGAATVATTLAAVVPKGSTSADAAYAVAEGAALGAYQYLTFKTKGEPTKLPEDRARR